MPPSHHIAVLAAGVLVLCLALLMATGFIAIRDKSRQLPTFVAGSRESIAVMAYPRAFTYLFFASISLAYSDELVTTSLGKALCLCFMLYMLLTVTINFWIPELRRGSHVDTALALAAAGCYAYGALAGRGI